MTTPAIDPRHFQDIVDEAKRRIPQYCPEWTDHNVSDPGVTLIELFAWMTDLIRYRLNTVPDRQYRQFLKLIGARPRPAVPARVELAFWLSAAPLETKVIPVGTEVSTRQTSNRPSVVFATEEDLEVKVPELAHFVLGWRRPSEPRGVLYREVTEALERPNAQLMAFQPKPQPGDAFYLGFKENLGGQVVRLNLRCETAAGFNIIQDDPPLAWEFWDGEVWRALTVEPNKLPLLPLTDAERDAYGFRLDATGGLNNTGSVLLLVPRTCTTTTLTVDGRQLDACWIRCRADRRNPGEPFYDSSPVLNGVQAECIGGMVMGTHQSTYFNEELGRSTGDPAQVFTLGYSPVLPRITEGPDIETVEVERADEEFEQWLEVDRFGDSSPTDPHFMIDDYSGEVIFGPMVRDILGQERQYGRIPAAGRRIRFTRYRTGGGGVGNVGRGSLVLPSSSANLDYVRAVTNLESASGGRDGETLEQQMLRGPELVRTRDVAITRADFESMVLEHFPQISQALCRVVTPEESGGTPSYLKLNLVPVLPVEEDALPQEKARVSQPRRELARAIRSYLQQRTPVTTELAVVWAGFEWVSVYAKVIIRLAPGLAPFESEAARNAVREEVNRRLYRYIHPSGGGPEGAGWTFGRPLTADELVPMLEDLPAVRYVPELTLRRVSFEAKGRVIGPDEKLITPDPERVLCSDHHVIEVVVAD